MFWRLALLGPVYVTIGDPFNPCAGIPKSRLTIPLLTAREFLMVPIILSMATMVRFITAIQVVTIRAASTVDTAILEAVAITEVNQ